MLLKPLHLPGVDRIEPRFHSEACWGFSETLREHALEGTGVAALLVQDNPAVSVHARAFRDIQGIAWPFCGHTPGRSPKNTALPRQSALHRDFERGSAS